MVVILTSGRVGTYGWLHKTPCHSSMKMSCLRRPHPDSRPSASCTIAAGLAPWSPWCEVLPVYVTAISFLLWLHTFPSMIFIHTQESHIPRLKDGFHWKIQHIVNLIYKQHFWKWKCFQFHFCSSHFKSVHYHYTKISLSIYTGSKWHTGYRTDKIHGLLKYFTA